MEFGPGALGNRSILADLRRKEMKDTLNSRTGYLEPFGPSAPQSLPRLSDYFETSYTSPFMVMAYKIKPQQQERLAAVTHNDVTGRLQTVERAPSPLYWKLIEKLESISGVGVLLTTSFNENEPVVDTPQQALDCFLRTQTDVLVMGPFLVLKKENQNASVERVGSEERYYVRV